MASLLFFSTTNGYYRINIENQNNIHIIYFCFQVSWVRRRDWHILSSGVFMYTNDDRFHVMHADNADNWDLQIKYVQKRDAGSYECQV